MIQQNLQAGFDGQDLLEEVPVGACLAVLEGGILKANAALAAMLGYDSPDELLKLTADSLAPLFIRPLELEQLESLLQVEGEALNRFCRLLGRDGTERWVLVNARSINAASRSCYRLFVTDVTELRHQERAILRQSSASGIAGAMWRNTMDALPDPVALIDREHRIVSINRAMGEALGCSGHEAAGGFCYQLVHGLEEPPEFCPHARMLKTQKVETAEVYEERLGGYYLVSTTPVRDASGRLLGSLHVARDINDRKQAEEDQRLAREESESASQAKTRFLTNMSHEIRTPLNGIIGSLHFLQSTSLDQDQEECVNMALTSAGRLNLLLSDILTLSNIESGLTEVHEKEFKVRDLCRSVQELYLSAARDKDITLECIPDPELPEFLRGDFARVRQIMVNLVGNAIKYTSQGRVEMELDRIAGHRCGDLRVLITVSDTGMGMSEDMIRNLVQPFVQADGSRTRKYEGAGLGLAVVHRLVSLMNGNMSIESLPGQGTTVHVSLPFKLAQQTPGAEGRLNGCC